MRVLLYPTYEFMGFVEADSSFILMRAMYRFLNEQPDCFPYWVVPEGYGKYQEEKGLVIETNVKKNRDLNEVLPYEAMQLFNPIDGKYPIDAVITNNAGKATEILNYFSLLKQKRVDIPVYIWDFSTKFHGSDCELSNIDPVNLAHHAMAYCMSAGNFFFSDFSRRKARENALLYCSPSMVKQFDDHSHVFPVAFDSTELKHYVSPVKEDKMSFYFGGRFTASKGGEVIAKHYDYLYQFGRDIRIKITTPSKSNRRLQKFLSEQGQEMEIYYGLSQPEAWRVMSSCHISIYHQSLKMFPAAPWEQLYGGLVVMFRDYGHEKDILPPDYPFLYKDRVDAAAMVRWIMENYEEAKSMIEYVKPWIEEHVDRRVMMNRMLALLREHTARPYKEKRIVGDVMFGKNEIGWDQLVAGIKNKADNPGLVFGKTDSPNKGMFYGELYQRHIPRAYCDNCRNDLPFYVRDTNVKR